MPNANTKHNEGLGWPVEEYETNKLQSLSKTNSVSVNMSIKKLTMV